MVIATFEIPGASRDKIAIEVSGNRLTISGEIASSLGPNQDYILRERKTGPFRRTLQLPSAIPVSHPKRCCVIDDR
jgi:HSP20 family molecular chaperone IbpA